MLYYVNVTVVRTVKLKLIYAKFYIRVQMVARALDLKAPSNATVHLVMVEQHAVIVSLMFVIH